MTERANVLSRFARKTETALGTIAVFSYRRAAITLPVIALLTGIAFWVARDLEVNSDLTELLPKSFRSIQDLEKLTERFGGVGWLCVVGRDAEPAQLQQFADDLAPKLEQLKFVRYVDYKRPSAFLEERALFFLDIDDLQSVNDRLKARMDWEKRKHNPLYLDLEESEPPPLEFDDLKKKYLGANDGAESKSYLVKQMGDPYYIDKEKRMIVLFAKPASQSIDLAFSKQIVTEVEQLVAGLDLKKYGDNFNVAFTGRYKKRVDLQRQITSDLVFISVLASFLVLAYLAWHFRRFLMALIIFAPLAVSLTWAGALVVYAFGTLNILTGFVGAIMTGLSVDQGLHLMTRYEAERAEGQPAEESIRRTFGQTGRALAVSGITNAAAFAMLGLSEFRAFKEFGVVAALAMFLAVVAFLITLPAILRLAHALGWTTRKLGEHASFSRWPGFLNRWAWPLAFVSIAVIATAVALLPRAGFDYDFRSLESNTLESFVVDIEVNKILGFDFVPVALLTETVAEERMVIAALRERQKQMGKDSTIDMVTASADFLPLEQEAKVPYLRAIGETIKDVKAAWINDPQQRQAFAILQRAVKAEPFTRDDFPEQMKLLFRGVGGKGEQGFVLVFPSIFFQSSSGKRIVDFANEVRDIVLPDGREVSASGEDLILADILLMVEREGPMILSLAVGAIVLIMLLLLGSVRDTAVCLVAPVTSMVLTIGFMPLFGVHVNYLNMVLLPTLFGMGEDGSTHLVTRVSAGDPAQGVISEVARGVSGALIANVFGFGSLILANHDGLRSFGAMALVGLGSNFLVTLVMVPVLVILLERRRNKRRATPST